MFVLCFRKDEVSTLLRPRPCHSRALTGRVFVCRRSLVEDGEVCVQGSGARMGACLSWRALLYFSSISVRARGSVAVLSCLSFLFYSRYNISNSKQVGASVGESAKTEKREREGGW